MVFFHWQLPLAVIILVLCACDVVTSVVVVIVKAQYICSVVVIVKAQYLCWKDSCFRTGFTAVSVEALTVTTFVCSINGPFLQK